ncbi:MAG TPA: UvrD-helicase domain-containing protein [Ktedonobacteraceae bacterium]|nr:UvrD-helicase domain-containing protein [Ktedonobacteraceae bacterium]
MDERRRVEVVEVARQLLARFQAEQPQWVDDRTPVDELVAWYGLEVATFHPDDHPRGTYGFLERDEPLIWLCRGLPETFRRFTLAHELGHAVLHQESTHIPYDLPELSPDDPCQQPDVLEEVTVQAGQEYMAEVLGVGVQYDPRSERELEANLFAAELLMPLERVRTLYLVEQIPPHQLAATFDVSNAALLNRLAGLLSGEREETRDRQEDREEREEQKDHFPIPAKVKHYDEFQQAAIEAQTPALIVAGPGSGKTSTLIGRAEYLARTLGVPPEQILALTFSRKAAREMRERLQTALHETHETTRMPTVSTFHAFCAEILRNYGGLVGLRPNFALVDETEGYFLLRQQARLMRLQHYRNLSYPDLYFPAMLKAISRAKDELVTPEQYRVLAEEMLRQAQEAHDDEARQKAEKALEVAAAYTLYEGALQERGDTDFGGLIMLAVRLFAEFPEVLHEQRQKYQHILVDEFQDINRASGILLRHLAGEERRVWVVGDANQAIYGFRGASPANIASFEQDYPGAVIVPLSRNYRSRPDIVSLAESFRYKQLELGQEVEPVKNQPVRLTAPETYVTVAKADAEAGELAGLLTDIRRKLAAGYSYRDIVVLCRTRSQARKIMRALALAGLPVIETGGMLGQEHIKDVLSIVLLLADSSGMGILRAARLSGHPLDQQDIETLLLAAREGQCSLYDLLMHEEAPAALSEQGRHSFFRLSAILRSLCHAPNVWSLLAQYLFIETSLLRDLLSAPSSKLRQNLLDDYASLLALARRYDRQQAERLRKLREEQEAREQEEAQEAPEGSQNSSDNLALPALREQAKGFLDYLSILLMLHQDSGNRQQSEDGGEEAPDVIRVMTIHASKGLEFPVVYLPGLVQQRFPIRRQPNATPAPEGMLPEGSEGEAAHESGEACLFYVGVTRARDALILSYSTRYGKRNYKRSPYIDALLAGLPGERVTHLEWRSRDEDRYLADAADDLIPASQPGEHFIQLVQPAMLSVSDIEAYQRCPRQYAYSCIYCFQREAGAYSLFWRATQKTVEALQKSVTGELGEREQEGVTGTTRTVPNQQEARDLYTRHWQELGGHLTPFASLYEQHGHEVVDLLLQKLASGKSEPWGTRQNYTVDIDGRTILVPVDRVEAAQDYGQGEEKKPVRFVRTGFRKPREKPAVEAREMLYARALRQHHPNQQLELHFHNLSTGEVVPIALTEKKEQKLYQDLVELILGMERHEYPINPDPFRCPTCPYFLICPA